MLKFWGKKDTGVFDFSQLGTDMHSHLLPGIDDGSPDLETSLKLIRGLMGLGFKKFITTPHIMWDMYKNTRDGILQKQDELRNFLEKSEVDVEVHAAAEYFLDGHVKKLLADREPLLTIQDNLVLVEFSLASEPLDLKELLFEMQMQGYQPVIAHPERYIYLERNRSFFEELKLGGCFFQLNIMSLAGTYGKSSAEMAKYFIKNQYYELAGTDLHNMNHLSHLQNPAIATGIKELIESGRLMNTSL
jgi:tyrosine-protein phosphatase YwqE